MLIQGMFSYVPQNAGVYVRISDDPRGLERGVKRQIEDCRVKGDLLGWKVGKEYCENDTSAYRKKKTTLPDGTVDWRVDRPKWRQMLEDLYHGRIDGIIVYDQDRLLRQPRDLEDLIDIVEFVKRPVTGITSSINLLTSEGRMLARVLAAAALKSSEDTARRVSRAKLEDAVNGTRRKVRRFGWTLDGEIIEDEAKAVQAAAATVLKTGSWTSATVLLEHGAVRPMSAEHWSASTVRNLLLSPTIAGLSLYRGAMRENSNGNMNAADPASDAIKDAEGNYVKNGLPEILEVATWEKLCQMVKDAHEGKPPVLPPTKKYLLSGMLKCGSTRNDDTVCGTGLIGTVIRRKKYPDRVTVVYKCPGVAHGGCGKTYRQAAPVDAFITDWLFRYLKRKAPRQTAAPAAPVERSANAVRLEELQERLADMRNKYNTGDPSVSKETFFSSVPAMEATIKTLTATVAKEQTAPAPRYTPDEVAAEWEQADTAGKRAILSRYLVAIEVKPSAAKGRAPFDHTAIVPIPKGGAKR